MRKWIAAMLLAGCLLWVCTACGTGGQTNSSADDASGSSSNNSSDNREEEIVSPSGPTDSQEESPAEPEETPSAQEIPQVLLERQTRNFYTASEDWLFSVDSPDVSVEGTGWEALAQAVTAWNEQQAQQWEDLGAQLSTRAEDTELTLADGEPMYSVYREVTVSRCDDTYLSLLLYSYENLGTDGPGYTYEGVTFRSSDGKILDLQETMTALAAAPEETDLTEIVWYLDAAGLTVVRNPEGTIADRDQTRFVSLADTGYQDWLPESAYPSAGEAMAWLTPDTQAKWMTAAGEVSLQVQSATEEEYGMPKFSLLIDEQSLEIGDFDRMLNLVLLRLADGRSFAVMDFDYASNDYVTILCEITDGTAVLRSRLEDTGIQNGNVNTEGMTLCVYLDVLGSYRFRMDYIINDSGTLEQTEEVFRRDPADPEHELPVIREVPVTINGEATTLPVGSVIRITGTDNAGTAYFQVIG